LFNGWIFNLIAFRSRDARWYIFIPFGYTLEGLEMKNSSKFNGHLVYFYRFWCALTRKNWQPCSEELSIIVRLKWKFVRKLWGRNGAL
jgi:hypothetical protein